MFVNRIARCPLLCALPLSGVPAHALPDHRNPNSVAALVTPLIALPHGFRPRGLVVPNVRFTFSGFDEKRQVRRDVATPLRRLFAAASADGVRLAAVSGYRSESTQRDLYDAQVARDGRERAERVVARPRHSEHETGLAIDVSGADGRCQASACFAGTREARWLAAHAADSGFIVRYPRGAEAITGYAYEPWHLRYVGVRLARETAASGETLEQYLGAVSG